MRRRSNAKRCLFCLAYCSTSEEDTEGEGPDIGIKRERLSLPSTLDMVGANNCRQLQLQMQNVFILRKILDIPESFCEETLLHKGLEEQDDLEGNAGGDGGNPANWFTLCSHCIETSVAQAWRVYQQILALEVKLLGIKENVKERMKAEMVKPQNRSWASRQLQITKINGGNDGGGGGVEGKIRRYIFPDFQIKTEDKFDLDADAFQDDEMEVDNISNYSEDDWIDDMTPTTDPLCDDTTNNGDIDVDIPSKIKRYGPGRGRPSLKYSSSSSNLFKRKLKLGLAKRRGRPPKNPDQPPRQKLKRLKKRFLLNDQDTDTVRPKRWNWHCCHEPLCRAKYTSLEEMETHQQLHSDRKGLEKGPLDCPHCPFPAAHPEELELHIKNRHQKQTRIHQYSCPKCDFRLENDFTTFKSHFDQNHPSTPEEIGLNDPEITSSELPVTCHLCPRRCENLRYFSVHLRKMHPEHVGIQVEHLECDLCGLKYSTHLELNTHINAEHKRPSKYVCDQCGQGYQFLSRLEAHKIKHVNKTKRDYVCHLCGLDYAYKYVLENHYRKCHPTASPSNTGNPTSTANDKYTCKYCEFTSPLKGIMIRHLQQHKQEVGHRCDQCGKFYVNEAGLKRHLKINHPLVKEDIPCPYCSKTFVSTEYMKDHLSKYCKMKKMGLQPSTSFVSGPIIAPQSIEASDILIKNIIGGDQVHLQQQQNLNLNEQQQQSQAQENVKLDLG